MIMHADAVSMRAPLSIWIAGSIDEVVADADAGLVDAIVTNPTVMANWCADGRSMRDAIAEVVERASLPLFVQLRGPRREQMLQEAETLRGISQRVLPKLPSTMEGLRAAMELASRKVPMLVTTICSVAQAAMFAAVGADFLCPYYARLMDAGGDPDSLMCDISDRFRQQQVPCRLVPASIRTIQQAEHAWLSGADGVIVFHELFCKLLDHEVTRKSLEGFEADDWPRIRLSRERM